MATARKYGVPRETKECPGFLGDETDKTYGCGSKIEVQKPGKWRGRLKPAVCPNCLILTHGHMVLPAYPEKKEFLLVFWEMKLTMHHSR